MGIITRFVRIWKADLHGVMDQLEDKELLLKQHLRDMEESLRAKEARLARLAQLCGQSGAEIRRRDEEARGLEKGLDAAVRKNQDEAARILISKRRGCLAALARLRQQADSLEEERAGLQELLARQRRQYEELNLKASCFSLEAGRGRSAGASGLADGPVGFDPPTDAEIDLELMQRKEALQGGAP